MEDAVIDDPRFYEMIHTRCGHCLYSRQDQVHENGTGSRRKGGERSDMLLYQGVIAYELWNPQVRVDSGTIKAAKQMIEDYLIRKQAGEGRERTRSSTGFMGAGKTSVGEHFAARYRMPMIDTDKEIEAAAGMAISDIFATLGRGSLPAPGDRRAGKAAEAGVAGLRFPWAADCLQGGKQGASETAGTVVYLDVLPETVMERIGADVLDRPMLHGSDVMGRIISLLESRKPYYLEASHIIVDVNGRDVDDIVEEIHRRAVDKTC
ncbi:MAG: shikimate kinase [Enterocloster clostridioformis]